MTCVLQKDHGGGNSSDCVSQGREAGPNPMLLPAEVQLIQVLHGVIAEESAEWIQRVS